MSAGDISRTSSAQTSRLLVLPAFGQLTRFGRRASNREAMSGRTLKVKTSGSGTRNHELHMLRKTREDVLIQFFTTGHFRLAVISW
jgi:hypothetical protein